MLRKVAVILAPLLLCLPIWGGVTAPACLRLPDLLKVHQPAQWWLGPYQLAIAAACLLVLSLTVCLRQQHAASVESTPPR